MEYVKVKPCKMRGCGRPVWDGGEICSRCQEEMDALGIEDEPKTLGWWFSVVLTAACVFLLVWGWLLFGGAR